MTSVTADIAIRADATHAPTQSAVGTHGSTRYLVAAVCVFLIALMLFPVVMSFMASIKTPAEAMASPPTYLPHALSLDNYLKVYSYQAGLLTYLFNSLAVAFLTIVFCLVLAVPAAYGLARFPVPGKEILFLILLLGLMIPYQALVTPLYLMFSKVGLSNTQVGLALVHTIVQLPFSVFLLRNSFEAVPKALEEAAVIDGCNSWGVLWKVFLPLVKAGIVTVILFAFIASWNEFLGALIFMSREDNFTIPIMLVSVRSGRHGAIDWGALQAGVVIAIIPCIAIYVLLQKYHMSGFLSGAVK
jgi:multiple sugar transport system permease protein